MKPVNKHRSMTIVIHILGTLLITGIILAVDFLIAGMQERLIPNIYPDYEPDLVLANRIIITSTVAAFLGLVIYILIIWMINHPKRIEQQITSNGIVDADGSMNFKELQSEISKGIGLLKDLFIYLITIVVIVGLFLFLRFIWIFSKYRSHTQLFIQYYLTNISSMIITITLYLALGFMINYVVTMSLQKYTRLQIISKSYDSAMEKVLENYDRLISEDQEGKS
jgi:hypothetical protein